MTSVDHISGARETVSIVICTDGRVDSLRSTLESLRQLDYRDFEVCVVYGPTTDGTRKLLEHWSDPIKTAPCPVRNLSVSRNIGIGLAAGRIVAFLDDDAIPEPEWLDQIVAAYSDDRVGGAGGFVHDHHGVGYQWRFGTTDRLGRADTSWSRATPEFNFPLSANFPHLLGANSTFRRDVLLAVGGFDEEYDYFLDETDLICRIVDHGWHISQISGAFVHHKYLPSAVRGEDRVIRSWYSVFKNKIYFSLVNGRTHHTMLEVLDEVKSFIEKFRNDLNWAISHRYLSEPDRARFDAETEQAWQDGLARGLAPGRKLMNAEQRRAAPSDFKPFIPSRRSGGGRTFVLLTQEYPPVNVGGVGRYVHQLAVNLALLGYQVHVLTVTGGHSRVDLEDAVWVHRMARDQSPRPPAMTEAGPVPDHIWVYSSTMLDRIEEIASRRRVDCVYAPVWDCEGAAILRDGRFPLMVGLQTTLKFWLESHPEKLADENFMRSFGRPMLALEEELLNKSSLLHSISKAIARDIEAAYGTALQERAVVVPLGLDDFTKLPRKPAPSGVAGTTRRVLFVGRLEARKGVDVLLKVAPPILARFPDVQFDLVGNDTLPNENGRTYREEFEKSNLPAEVKARVLFHGAVSEESLRGFYEACDVFVAPSRFESFGLIFVEAMMFSKPVIGCRAGGMPEVIEEGRTGLLAKPGDPESLREALEHLLLDQALCRRLGAAGRERYEQCFTSSAMAKAMADLMTRTSGFKSGEQPALKAAVS